MSCSSHFRAKHSIVSLDPDFKKMTNLKSFSSYKTVFHTLMVEFFNYNVGGKPYMVHWSAVFHDTPNRHTHTLMYSCSGCSFALATEVLCDFLSFLTRRATTLKCYERKHWNYDKTKRRTHTHTLSVTYNAWVFFLWFSRLPGWAVKRRAEKETAGSNWGGKSKEKLELM